MIFLLRHGNIAVQTKAQGRPFVGQADYSLDQEGRDQIALWVPFLASKNIKTVWCGDLSRTRESTDIFIEELQAINATLPNVQIDPDLREINLGDFEGLSVEEVKTHYPGAWEARGKDLSGYRPVGGESFSDLSKRVMPIFSRIVQKAEETAENFLIITHAGVIRVILANILGMPLGNIMRLDLPYASLCAVAVDKWAKIPVRVSFTGLKADFFSPG